MPPLTIEVNTMIPKMKRMILSDVDCCIFLVVMKLLRDLIILEKKLNRFTTYNQHVILNSKKIIHKIFVNCLSANFKHHNMLIIFFNVKSNLVV